MEILFQEKQKFTQWWLWVLLIGCTFLPVFGIYKQIIKKESFGNQPMSDTGLLLLFGFMILFLLFFWMMQLSMTIDKEAIQVKFFPFLDKTISWKEVKSAEVLNYGFVGGWGVRIGTKYGTVYNVKGNKGLAIVLKNGKKLCVGTEKEEELRNVIARLILEQSNKTNGMF